VNQETKILLCKRLKNILDEKLEEILSAINSLKESRDNNTKSSAGDKYETARAMLQIELDKSEAQLAKLRTTQNELERINTARKYEKAEAGSLVITSQGNYFISIGIGKLDVDGTSFYAISLASPLGLVLKDKIAGDTINFQGKEFMIRDII
jgi:hypothetical protein